MRPSLFLPLAATLLLPWLPGCSVPPFDAIGKRCSVDVPCPAELFCALEPGSDEGVCGPSPSGPDTTPPGPENTGVPADAVLTASNGFTVSEDGAIVEDLDVQGCVTVSANNVTLRRLRIRCSGLYVVRVSAGTTGTLLEDVELNGQGSTDTKGVVGTDLTVRRANVHGVLEAFVLQGRALYERSYVHDLVGDSAGLRMSGGEDVTVRANRVVMPPAGESSLSLRGALSPVERVRVEHNWLDGGGRGVSANGTGPGGSASHPVRDLTVVGNRFGRGINGAPGNAAGVEGLVWEDNVYDDTGEPVPAP